MEKRKFRLADVVLSVICVVFVAEAAAPVASIGNSQYFWWLFMILAFLLPYGLISSELGTAFPGDGGLYDWIHTAWPDSRWGARASWYYWINFPLWMASLAVMCPELLGYVFGWQPGPVWSLVIQLAFIWIVTVVAFYPVCDSIVILNLSAAIKILLAVTVGVLGIVYVARNGFVNDMSAGTFLPSFDLDSLSYISVIIFNFLGFEVVCTYAGSMADPRRQIPQAIVTGGVVIAAIYLFSAFGIGAAVPTRDISVDSGLIDAVSLMTGRTGGVLVGIVALLFLVTLFGNMISWSMGVNSTAAYAAERGDMPAVFTRRRKDNDMPVGSALVSGIVASAVCLLGAAIQAVSPDSSLFWSFFALNLVMLLLSYMPVFPAFLALRRKYPQAERPFRVPGGPGMLRVLAYVPMVLIGLSILFTAVPLSTDRETLATILPITVGSVISAAGRAAHRRPAAPSTQIRRITTMAKRIVGTTPRQDGYRMPGEFEEQTGVWMLWPQRPDNWRGGAKPAQQAFADVARAIARFEPVTVCVNPDQFQNARARLPEDIRVVEMTSNDAWVRDCGPTFVKNDQGNLRAVDWTFNAWGGLHDGLYFPWDQDDLVARKICELEGVDSYRTDGFVLEGGSIHVDGQGTVLTTEMCLLSPGRNPELSRRDIEEKLCDYLGCEKVIWLRDGIDPDETNGHIDDVACFVAPGEVACIWTEDPENPFYQAAQDAFRTLSQATDAKGRRLTVHKLCLTKKPCCLEGAETIDAVEGTVPRENGEVSIASYMNFLIVNGAVIAPQYGDENDQLAIQQLQQMFPDRQIVGVQTREVAFGGGNIHCITQQQPKA